MADQLPPPATQAEQIAALQQQIQTIRAGGEGVAQGEAINNITRQIQTIQDAQSLAGPTAATYQQDPGFGRVEQISRLPSGVVANDPGSMLFLQSFAEKYPGFAADYYASTSQNPVASTANKYAETGTYNKDTGTITYTPTSVPSGGSALPAPFRSTSEPPSYATATISGAQQFANDAAAAATLRPGYYSDIGDSKSAALASNYQQFGNVLGMMGMPVPNVFGTQEGSQRLALASLAASSPSLSTSMYYGGEYQKAISQDVERSAEYHYLGMVLGVPVPANPFEYKGDLAVEILKGSPTLGKDVFSPVSGEMAGYLPNRGMGIQQLQWQEAIVGSKLPGNYMGATAYLQEAGNRISPYDYLYGGKAYIGSPSSEGMRKQADFVYTPALQAAVPGLVAAGNPYAAFALSNKTTAKIESNTLIIGGVEGTQYGPSIVSGGRLVGGNKVASVPTTVPQTTEEYVASLPKPFVSGSPGKVQTLSVFDSFLSDANAAVSRTLGLDVLPIPTAEQYKQFAPQISLIPGAQPFGIALQTPIVADYMASYLKGEGEGLLQKPVNVAAAYGAGFALGVIGKGVEAGYESARVSFAANAISEGGGWRAAEQYAANVPKVAGIVLGGVYAGSVAARTTNMGTDFSPSSSERLGGIMGTEAIPGGVGVITGMGAPSAVYNAARVSDIGYKAGIQEGVTTGRFDYYVKQPVMKPYELAKIDYNAYRQEEGGGLIGYAIERAGLNRIPVFEPTTLKYVPVESGEIAALAYGKQNTIFDYFSKGTYSQPTTLKYIPTETGEVANLAYGKPSTIFDMLNAPIVPESTTLKYVPAESGEIAKLAYPESQQPLSMRIAAYVQENKPFENLQINLRYPAEEIAQTNKLTSDFAKTYGGIDATIREPITPLSKTFGTIVKSNAGRTPSEYKPPAPEIETRSSGGQVSVSKSSMAEPMSSPVMDTGLRGMPEYPTLFALLSPRQKYQIEEETQYLTLPPGVESPTPQKTSVLTYLIPMQEIATVSKSAMSVLPTQINLDRLVYQSIPTDISTSVKIEPIVASLTNVDPLTDRTQKQTPFQEITTKQTPDQIITPIVTPVVDITQRRIITSPPITPLLPPFPLLFPSSGGAGGGGGGYKPAGGHRKTEIFSYAPKNLKGLFGMPQGRTPAIKKPRRK